MKAIKLTVSRYLEAVGNTNRPMKSIKQLIKRLSEMESRSNEPLTKKEIMQIINVYPKNEAELWLLLDRCDDRFSVEQVQKMVALLNSF